MEWRHFSLGIWQNPQIFWDLHLYFTFSIDNRQDTALSCRGAPLRAAAGQFGKLGQSLGQLSTTRIYDDKALYLSLWEWTVRHCQSRPLFPLSVCWRNYCNTWLWWLSLIGARDARKETLFTIFTFVASSQLWMILWPAQYSWKLCSEKTFCIFF